jgi:hypothetical protein
MIWLKSAIDGNYYRLDALVAIDCVIEDEFCVIMGSFKYDPYETDGNARLFESDDIAKVYRHHDQLMSYLDANSAAFKDAVAVIDVANLKRVSQAAENTEEN